MKSKTVLEAVQSEKAVSKQGILQKLFAIWFDAFVYNQIWEDPQVDVRALELDERSRILTISSGGCNALNYLLENPESVTAVDLNRHHIFLLNLKIAALKSLPVYEKFFDFFGFGISEKAVEDYRQYIAPQLDAATGDFWESGSPAGRIAGRRRIDIFRRGGLYHHSRNGYFLGFFHKFAHLLGVCPEKVLAARTPAEQLALYEKEIEPFFNSLPIRIIGKMPVTMFGLGIPPQQYDELKKELGADKTIIDVYKQRVKRLAVDYPIDENYFAWQAFARKYDTGNCRAVPDYLKSENFETLRARIGRLETRIGSVTEVIKNQPAGAFNRFVFLDAQDWMNQGMLTELWQAIADKGERGARIIFRTAGADSPIEANLPEALRGLFVYEKELSEELFTHDRASIYGGFHLYIRN